MLRLNRIFSDGCIIQRDCENEVYGVTDPESGVTVRLLKDGGEAFSASAKADNSGRWSVTLPPFEGSIEAYSMTVTSGSESVEVRELYFGELFHISGQSNMELPLSRTLDYMKEELLPAENPLIREFRVPVKCRFSKTFEADDFDGGEWKKAVGADIYDMSATGYYFAADIFKRLLIPVGLVNTSAGGTAVESFMPYEMIRGYRIHDEFLEKATADNYIEETTASDLEREKKWYEALGTEDFGLTPTESMKSCTLPCTIDEMGLSGFSGRLFFFKEVFLPEDFPNENVKLIMGTVADSDAAFVNGVPVGETAYLYPPRDYVIPDGVLKAGRNVIAMRVEVRSGRGGFTRGRRYCLKCGVREFELSGEWKYAVAKTAEPLGPSVFFQGLPLAIHADMLYPALRIRFRALIWYQGESNCGRAEHYTRMFSDFIGYYREKCGYDIPVIYAQLCNYEGMCGCYEQTDSWARLRQAQLKTLNVRNTAMAVTVDLGEYNDLHPKNKRGVGQRLARQAFRLIYGDNDVPFVRCIGAKRTADGVTLIFDGNVSLMNRDFSAFEAVSDGGARGCAILGGETCSDTVSLECSGASSIRYAWSNAPRVLNLYDLSMTPLSPFEIAVKE